MTMTAGGSSGITFPDSTTLAAINVTTALSPGITDTANVMTINGVTIFNGTAGLTVNGITYTTVPPLTVTASYLTVAGGGGGGGNGGGGGAG